MIKGIVFGMDGVLASTNRSWINLYRKIAQQAGVARPLSDEEVTKDFGERYEAVMGGIVGTKLLPKAMELFWEYMHSGVWMKEIKQTPYCRQALDELKKRELKLGVVSGNTAPVLEKMLDELGIKPYFQTLVSADDVARAKPDPESLKKALQKMQIKNTEAIYVGDAANDVKCARAAGVRTAVVLTGALDKQHAGDVRPDWIFEDLRGLVDIL
jgi:HAD superfamily hydrolase (TIGR01549 family)